MAIKITETVERDCCDPVKDMRTYMGLQRVPGMKEFQFCIHCGQFWGWQHKKDDDPPRDAERLCIILQA